MDRRDFLRVGAASAAALAFPGAVQAAPRGNVAGPDGDRMRGHFSMTQISSVLNTHGNAYLFRTRGGKVVMVDGGFEAEAGHVRELLWKAGNHVDLWFISHPHRDHMGAFDEILKDPQGISVDKVVYSRVPDSYLDLEGEAGYARGYYRTLDSLPAGSTDVVNLHNTGQRFDIDGIGIKVLGVSNPEIRVNPYNNQSVVIRLWDDSKSVVLLGDAGIEAGDKLLASPHRAWLDCDYMQMAHHGQSGCSEAFYKAVDFRACLWPAPMWLWEPAPQHAHLKTRETRRWMDEKGITEHHVACLEVDWVLE